MLLPAVVVVAYNRPHSLERLLNSISRASFNGHKNVPLVISIDGSGCRETLRVADGFAWGHGSKRVIEHKEHLGLRKHVISCGDLVEEYGAVIVLEDDLYVSPIFYHYAVQAMRFYGDDENISGISLFSYDCNEYTRTRFYPLEDGYDNYFVQSASSWGQLWTEKQWHGFRSWYNSNEWLGVNTEDPLPDSVIRWPESSWKKYFIKYVVLENKYFVYPRVSLTTNIGERGTHNKSELVNNRVPLTVRSQSYKFSALTDSLSVYDAHFEIERRCVVALNNELDCFDFECDLYGSKDPAKIQTEHLLSIRDCAEPIFSFSMEQIPHELNVILGRRGDFFHLARPGDFGATPLQKQLAQWRMLHKDLGWRRYGQLFWEGLLDRLRS